MVLHRRAAHDRELDEEVQHYLDLTISANEARGMAPEAARRAARLEVGSSAQVREAVREAGWESVVAALGSDLRLALRRLRLQRGSSLLIVATLALGIGASVAIFDAVYPTLLRPLPYPQASRLQLVWDTGPEGARTDVTFGTFRELQARSKSIASLAVMRPWQPASLGEGRPERLDGQRVSADYFRTLGAAPLLGRDFEPGDDLPGAGRFVIVSHSLWQRRLGGDSAVVGRPLRLADDPYTVVGVMPAGFVDKLSPAADVWSPLQYDPSLPARGREWGHHLRLVARLAPDVSLDAARREVAQLAARPTPEFARPPWASLGGGLMVLPLQRELARDVAPALLAVSGAVLLLLLIAAVNVTHLLLVRGGARTGEYAMRATLGASRGRIVRQVLTESLVLGVAGAAAGLLIARAGSGALLALAPASLSAGPAGEPSTSATLLFTIGVAVLVGLVVGVVPAVGALGGMRASGLIRGSSRAIGTHPARRTLVVAEVTLALVLLAGAGLLGRSLNRLLATPAGFDPAGVLTMQVMAAGHRYDDAIITNQFYAAVLEAVRRIPGVTAAGFTSQLPLSGDLDQYGAHFESFPTAAGEDDQVALRYAVTPGYLEAMRIPLLKGRPFDDADSRGPAVPALLSASFADRRFAGVDPIGQRLHLGRTDLPWYTVVGVVGDVKQSSLAMDDGVGVYVPAPLWYATDRMLSLVVRTTGNPAALADAVRIAIRSVDPDQPVVRLATMESLVSASTSQLRFARVVFEVFSAAALLLAAIGMYGVLAGSVHERRRELGVRAALGASRALLVRMVLREGLALALLGVTLGVLGAAWMSQGVGALLHGISPLDPATYAAVVMLMLAVSALSCWVPAWRAGSVDPAGAMRGE